VANKAKQQRGIRALPLHLCLEASNKKKGDKRGVLGGIEGGRKVTRPARG